MNLFYTEKITDSVLFLDDQEAMHCTRVLRMNAGDELMATDGKGNMWKGNIMELKKNKVRVQIIEKKKYPRPQDIHIAIAPTKSIDRFEWFLEKATECGVTHITPLISFHSERRKINLSRLERVIISAAKQSLRAWFPGIDPLTPLQALIEDQTNPETQRYIAHCQRNALPHLFNITQKNQPVLLLIGPEGDFSDEEINAAVKHKFTEVSLGNNRLRTETAGLTGCQLCNLKNEI